ncbi:unnamed protein product [Lasius platythorax]|uniref:Uncharacterized protein n=1 Tax=Lasius platythorax TaxID=488582 RepID=A0AAV2MW67_9HYME
MEEWEGEKWVEESWAFKEGKRVMRSPQRGVVEGEGGEGRWWKEIKEDWKKELKDGIREVKEMLREELRGHMKEMREEMKIMVERKIGEKEEKWRQEKEEMRKRIEELEERMKDVATKGEGKGEEEKGKGMEERIKRIEMREERKEREERRRNIVIKGLRGGEKEVERRVGEILKELGIETEGKEKRYVGGRKEGEKGIAIIKLNSVEEKKEVIRKRRDLKDKEVRIDDDLTWKERMMRRNLEKVAWGERGRNKRVWVGYGKIQIDGKWWRWEEEEERLRDDEGKIWREQGEKREGEGNGKG